MEEKRKPRPWLTWLVVGLMCVYPVTVVPAAFLVQHNSFPRRAMVIYAPLVFAWESYLEDCEMPHALGVANLWYAYYWNHARLRRMLIR